MFRARDTRLDRTVAIKVLAQDRSDHPELRKRFDQEARAIATLSHPHICHLNDVGHEDGIDFLVMEYLQGETLANRLASAGLPLRIDEVIRYAVEIAEALSEAHRHGIVHRDLKPTNVFLARTGGPSSLPSVKLLDFGLAKLHAAPGAIPNSASTAATKGHPLTEEGAILGTWRYMAPEQLEGKAADARTDVFAFGVVVYEMATGKKPFDGDSHASVIAAILDSEPSPISTLQPTAPAALVRIITKCLAKNPDARWQSARDLADALKWIGDERSEQVGRAPVALPPRSAMWRGVAGVVAASAVIGAIIVSLPRQDATVQLIRRFSIVPPADAPLAESQLAISPDGRYIVHRARTQQGLQLYLRALDQLEARLLPGTVGGYSPAFSPDSQWVAFVAADKLQKISLTAGAAPVTLSDLPNRSPGMTWLPDNNIITGQIEVGLFRTSGLGGPVVALTTADVKRREIDHHNPSWLPGGKALLITVHNGAEAFDVAVQTLGTEERRIIIRNGFDARYLPSGHLVFARGDSLFAATFDPDQLQVTGPEIAVVENVATVP